LEMSFVKSSSELTLKIRDFGIGFSPEELHKGHGLMNIRKRAVDLNGEAFLDASPGNGCEWVIKFPLEQIVV
jgi:signal transduction histidine kinase